ncbi:hypothetical protein SPPR111872_05620 [Sphingobacterium prati]
MYSDVCLLSSLCQGKHTQVFHVKRRRETPPSEQVVIRNICKLELKSRFLTENYMVFDGFVYGWML